MKIVIVLNNRWRVVDDEREAPYRSWELQYRDGSDHWKGRSFCQTRKALLTAINEKVIRAAEFYPGGKSSPVAPDVLETVRNLPARCTGSVGQDAG